MLIIFLLLKKLWNKEESIRGLCVGVTNVSDKHDIQLSIFNNDKMIQSNDKLQKTLDNIRGKYGNNIINYADMIRKKDI